MKTNKFLIVIIIIFLLSIGYILENPKLNNQAIACTEEALVCPDGSAVGRTGPQCEFNTCNQLESITGMLQQNDAGFFLTTVSGNNFNENYQLPLELKVTNTLRDFIDKKVIISGKFISGNTYAVDSISEGVLTDKQKITLGVNNSKNIDGLSIKFNKLVQDYRCSVDEDCMEAGGVVANVTLTTNRETKTFNLPSDQVPTEFADYFISIIDVKPEKSLSSTIDPSDYEVTFEIERKN